MANFIARRRFMASSLTLATALATPGISLGKARGLSSDEYLSYSDLALAAPLTKGPFTGVPLLLKDLGIALKGTVMTETLHWNDSAHDSRAQGA